MVQTTHESVRRDAHRRIDKEVPRDESDDDDQDTCVNGIDGHVLHDQNEHGVLDDQHVHTEDWAEWCDESSEKRVPSWWSGWRFEFSAQEEDQEVRLTFMWYTMEFSRACRRW